MKFSTKLEQNIIKLAKQNKKTIVLPEAGYSKRVYEAGMLAAKQGIANVVFLTKSDKDLNQFGYKPTKGVIVVNITNSELLPLLVQGLVQNRKEKGMDEVQAKELLKQEIYFATMMLELDLVDGLVSGAENTTANTLRPALQIIKAKTKGQIVSSYFIMISKNKHVGDGGVFVLADCGINQNPTEKELANIAIDTAYSAKTIAGLTPRVALLSYSTLGSAEGECPTKVRNVAKALNKKDLDFAVEGELQFDAAVVKNVAARKATNSLVAGNANVLVFPDLQSGNIGYKIMQRLGGFLALGPICQGLNKPVNDLSRGANVQEILLTIAITSLQS